MTPARAAMLGARVLATAAVVRNLARARHERPALFAGLSPVPPISVVVPARDEAARIEPLLAAIVDAPGVVEVVVVDDESTDGTAAVARRAGARVVAGTPPPDRWAGKAWALQQGLDAAAGEWIVALDADTRPSPHLPSALVRRAIEEGFELLTVAGRFECPTVGLRWLHPALLTTLVYRSAPPGAVDQGPVHRRMGNGQCLVARRSDLVARGGFRAVAHHVVEDVALVRAMATAGADVGFLEAVDLLTVRMYESAPEAWLHWGRSLALPGVESRARRVAVLGMLVLAQVAPPARLASRRGDVLDAALVAVRFGTLAGTAPAYVRRGAAYWLSPAADVLAVAALAWSTFSPPRPWRGRRPPGRRAITSTLPPGPGRRGRR